MTELKLETTVLLGDPEHGNRGVVSCSLPMFPFPIKSLALSAYVSPQTIYFQGLDKSPLLGPGRDWGQEEKGRTEDDMAGWHH